MKHFSLQRGFSLAELLIVICIILILLSLATINFTRVERKTTLTSTLETLITDLSHQQIKAMSGDTEGRTTTDMYGIRFNATSYILFHGTYSAGDSSNFTISLPTAQQIITSPGNETVFATGSGELVGLSQSATSITLRDTATGEQTTIQLNRYGVITGVN